MNTLYILVSFSITKTKIKALIKGQSPYQRLTQLQNI